MKEGRLDTELLRQIQIKRRHLYPPRLLFRLASALYPPQDAGVEINRKDQAIVACSKTRKREYQGIVACRKRRKKETHTPFLPREIIYHILLFLPAKVLHEVMRYVCKDWNDIVSDPVFKTSHRQLSSPGILVQDQGKLDVAFYLETSLDGLKVSEYRLPFPAILLGSCNGLALLLDERNPRGLHVMNLVTRVKTSLPPLARPRVFRERCFALAVTSSGHYKVVHVCGCVDNDVQVLVCTVGVDTNWRRLDIEGIITMTFPAKLVLLQSPDFIAGSIYWKHPFDGYGFALDVDAETMERSEEHWMLCGIPLEFYSCWCNTPDFEPMF